MDDLIVTFLSSTCSPEYANEVYRSFKICNDFEYPNLYSRFIDILTNESYASGDQLRDEFHEELSNKLNDILQQHNLKLVDTATLFQKNEMLTALYSIQSLEDYTPVILVLESLETDEVKLTTILEDYCQLPMEEQLSIITELNPVTLSLLKEYINQSLLNKSKQDSYRGLVPALKVFFKLFGRDNVGFALIDNEVKPGQTLDVYLSYIDNIVAKTIEQTAINVLSLIYMTPKSVHEPLTVYTENSVLMLRDLKLVSKVEPLVITMIGQVNDYLKAQQQATT